MHHAGALHALVHPRCRELSCFHKTLLAVLVDEGHGRGGRRHVVDVDEDGGLRAEADAFPNDVHELAHGEVGRDEVLLLINLCDVGPRRLFDDDGNTIIVLGPDLVGLGLALLCSAQRTVPGKGIAVNEAEAMPFGCQNRGRGSARVG